jgi:hypothetical protein
MSPNYLPSLVQVISEKNIGNHMCDGIVTGYERAVITTGQSYNIVPQ